MSDEESVLQVSAESLLTTEFRDGQLQIVEVASYGKPRVKILQQTETEILPDLESEELPETRYVQVLNSDKSVVQLDLLNMTLVRCEDGSDTTYKLVAEGGAGAQDGTLTCVLQASDHEEQDNQEDQGEDTYVVMNGEQGPLVFLQSELGDGDGNVQVARHADDGDKSKKPSPVEILAKAKALQKSGQIIPSGSKPSRRRGRKRKSEFPPPHELLASPNFKLFLYSCKLCHFKCNAVKEMTAHKATEHSAGSRARAGRPGAPLQCARCPYKGTTHAQLMRHVQDRHLQQRPADGKEVEEAHVLVCGACGFECSDMTDFKRHIRQDHGTSAVSV